MELSGIDHIPYLSDSQRITDEIEEFLKMAYDAMRKRTECGPLSSSQTLLAQRKKPIASATAGGMNS